MVGSDTNKMAIADFWGFSFVVVHLAMFSISRVWRRMVGLPVSGDKLEGRNLGLIEVLSWNLPGGAEGSPYLEFWTQHFPNTSVVHYLFTNLFGLTVQYLIPEWQFVVLLGTMRTVAVAISPVCNENDASGLTNVPRQLFYLILFNAPVSCLQMINACTINMGVIMEMIWGSLSDIQRLTNSLNANGLGENGGENFWKELWQQN
jgi:hypothetical protein